MRRLILTVGAAVAAVSLLAWLFWSPADSVTVSIDEPLPAADVRASELPEVFAGAALHTTPWEAAPKTADGVLLGLGRHGDRLRFTAVRSDGTALWHAERPLACAGFTVTTADDRAMAVLNDAEPNEDGTLRTTASAIDLRSGDLIWGPVEVPGPNYGPGLVYAAAPGEYFGEAGPLTALDSRTGEVLFTEPEEAGLRIIGEFDGTLLLADDTSLIGQDGDGERLWSYDAGVLPWPIEAVGSVPGIDPGGRWAVIGTDQGDGALIDTVTGTIHAHDVTAALADRGNDTVAYVSEERLVLLADNGVSWQRPVAGSSLSAVGSFGVAAQHEAGIDVFSLADGSPVMPADIAALRPVASTSGEQSATVLATADERFILAVSR